MCRFQEFESEGNAADKKCYTVSYAVENSSVFRCVLKVVMAAELFVSRQRVPVSWCQERSYH